MRCTNCRLSFETIKQMQQDQTEFYTAEGRSKIWIAEIDESSKTIRMRRSTGKITWPLKYQELKEIHDRIQQGQLILDKYEIDKAIPTWGNYITGLLNHLRCFKDR